MNPADLDLTGISPTLTTKNLSVNTSLLQKSSKAPVARVEVEPIYTQLKTALGDHWVDYKTALAAFVLGNLNQQELSWVLQPVLSSAPLPSFGLTASTSVLQLHNQLVTCICTNIIRDAPASDVAPWVVATDKPAAAKNAAAVGASDKAEERLKREIMALAPKDRRRIKQVKPDATAKTAGGLKDLQEYRLDLASRSGDVSKTTTSWDMETRRKYIQPLAAETLEFPSTSDLQNRIEPIAHEEGLVGSTQATTQACAELLEQAAEAYIKSVLGDLQACTRSNRTGCIQTAKFRNQVRKEQIDVERGTLQRTATGLLPVEFDLQAKREPLASSDMRLAMDLRDPFLIKDRFMAEKTMLDRYPGYTEVSMVNGDIDRMDVDTDELDSDGVKAWQGATESANRSLMAVLNECLAL